MNRKRNFTTAELLELHQLTAEFIRSQGYEPLEIAHPIQRRAEAGETIFVYGEALDGTATDPGPTCWTCDDRGFVTPNVPVGDPRHGQPELCPKNCAAAQALRRDHQQRVHTLMRLPAEYQGCTLESFYALVQASPALWTEKRLAYEAAVAFVQAAIDDFYVDFAEIARRAGGKGEPDWRNCLIFSGDYGVGKTGLLASIGNAVTPLGVTALYIRAMSGLKAIQDRYSHDWRDNPPDDPFGNVESGNIVDQLSSVPLLLLDEFDLPNLKLDGDKADKMQHIIRMRHSRRLATVITTNLRTLKDIGLRWGEPTAQVLGQMAHFIPVGGIALRPVPQQMVLEEY